MTFKVNCKKTDIFLLQLVPKVMLLFLLGTRFMLESIALRSVVLGGSSGA
jgi:hypothetical protein